MPWCLAKNFCVKSLNYVRNCTDEEILISNWNISGFASRTWTAVMFSFGHSQPFSCLEHHGAWNLKLHSEFFPSSGERRDSWIFMRIAGENYFQYEIKTVTFAFAFCQRFTIASGESGEGGEEKVFLNFTKTPQNEMSLHKYFDLWNWIKLSGNYRARAEWIASGRVILSWREIHFQIIGLILLILLFDLSKTEWVIWNDLNSGSEALRQNCKVSKTYFDFMTSGKLSDCRNRGDK